MIDNRPVYYPPSPNLGYKPPTFQRILRTLATIVGWVILVPAVMALALSALAIIFGVIVTLLGEMEVYALVGWLAIALTAAGMTALGLFLTGKVGPWHD